MNWLPPDINHNNTVIDHYELTVNGSDSNSNTFKIHTTTSLPYYFTAPDGDYTASVRAVDVCGQISEPSQMEWKVASIPCSLSDTEGNNQEGVAVGLGTAFASVTIVLLLLLLL